jgi:hypothetical protein
LKKFRGCSVMQMFKLHDSMTEERVGQRKVRRSG